jgi:hypothetical protein
MWRVKRVCFQEVFQKVDVRDSFRLSKPQVNEVSGPADLAR